MGLKHTQARFIHTINEGPDTFDPMLFKGDPQRVMLGIKAHANTISFAQLRALEETFPRMRSAIGEATFNVLSRRYCDTARARSVDNNRIGSGFAAYLTAQNMAPCYTDLARIEWAALESYHAADAPALALERVAVFTQDRLLALPVICHPAARTIKLCAAEFALIAELEPVPNIAAILITRPETKVQMIGIDAVTAAIFGAARAGCLLNALLQIAADNGEEDAALTPILRMIGAGALAALPPRG